MKKRILIADDDQSIRESLQKVLKEAGYAVFLAADGQQGAAKIEELDLDLVLLDLDLPKLSGFDLLDIAMVRRPLLSIIILTGLIDQCEPGALDGADAMMEKPPDVPELLKTISWLLTESPEERLRRACDGRTGRHEGSSHRGNTLRLPVFTAALEGRALTGNAAGPVNL